MIRRSQVIDPQPHMVGGLADIAIGKLQDGSPVVVRSLRLKHRWRLRVRNRFVTGCRARASLSPHPNVIPSLGFGTGSTPYEILPFVNGGTLLRWKHETSRYFEQHATSILLQIAEGLDHVHRSGFLHLDVKPENLLVDSVDGYPTCHLTDFDLVLDASREWHDKKLRFGTFTYMAPEHLKDGTISLRSDIFGYGVLAYQFCCGQLPYPGKTPAESRQQKLSRDHAPQHICRLSPWLPRPVGDFIMKCLHRYPEHRPGFVGIAVRDLRKLIG